jgi:hypothetical protein
MHHAEPIWSTGLRSARTDLGNREGQVMLLAMSTAGWVGLGIVGLIIWVALAFWPARVAGRKGHSFLGYFILSLFFFPLALVMAYVVKDRRGLAVRS